MSLCKSCANSRFDETLGEYKCVVKMTYIRKVADVKKCKDFKRKTSKD